MTAEEERARLIGEIASLLRSGAVPEDARAAGLTLIGYLARRMPGEGPHSSCVKKMLERALGCQGSSSQPAATPSRARALRQLEAPIGSLGSSNPGALRPIERTYQQGRARRAR